MSYRGVPGYMLLNTQNCRHLAGPEGSFPVSDGEGNGNPLQYSCLENPMNGGAW